MSFTENLSVGQIKAVRILAFVGSLTVGLVLIATSSGPIQLGMGALLTILGPMMSWVIGQPNRNKRIKRTH